MCGEGGGASGARAGPAPSPRQAASLYSLVRPDSFVQAAAPLPQAAPLLLVSHQDVRILSRLPAGAGPDRAPDQKPSPASRSGRGRGRGGGGAARRGTAGAGRCRSGSPALQARPRLRLAPASNTGNRGPGHFLSFWSDIEPAPDGELIMSTFLKSTRFGSSFLRLNRKCRKINRKSEAFTLIYVLRVLKRLQPYSGPWEPKFQRTKRCL